MAMDKLKLQVLMDLADRVSAPLARIGQGSKDAAEHIKAAKDKLKQLEETQRSIGQFREVRTGLTDTEAKLQAARDKVRQLAATYGQLGPPTKEAAAAMAAARNEAAQLGAKFNAQRMQAQQLRDKLSAAGISTKSLADHEKRLRADMTATTAQIQKKTEALKRQREISAKMDALKSRQEAAASKQSEARGALFDGVALATSLGAPLKMAMDFESAMADVAKVVNFQEANGLEKMSQDVIAMSKRLPMAATEIAKIFALGGQSGIAEKDLPAFAEHAVKMGTAFGMSAEEAGDSMSKMSSAFGMPIPKVAELSDKINYLANTGGASEKQILDILTSVGPLGAVAGVASGEIAALGSTLAGMGIAKEVAATGIQNLMLSLVAGEAATKSQRESFKKLGMDSVAVAKGMQEDATGTMLTIFEKLGQLEEYEQASVMSQMFGKESIKAIAPMLTQLKVLKENFAKVNDETRYGGAVSAEYATRAATSANKLQLAKNKAAALSIQLGGVLLPIMVDAVEAVAPWIDKLGALASAYPGVTKAVLLLTAGLMVGKIAAIALAYGWSFLKGGWMAGKAVLLTLRTAMLLNTGALVAGTTVSKSAIVISKAFAAAQWLVNAALAANPVGVVILALVALAAAAYMVYTRWDQIKAGALALWTDLSTLGAKFIQIGADMINGLVLGITSRLAAVRDAVVSAAQSVSGWFKETLGINSPSRVFIEHGGWISEGAAIGIERGKKLAATAAVGLATATTAPMAMAAVQAPTPLDHGSALAAAAPTPLTHGSGLAAAAPARAALAPAPAASSTYNITINAAPGMDAQAIADAVRAELDRRDRAARSRVYSQLSDME